MWRCPLACDLEMSFCRSLLFIYNVWIWLRYPHSVPRYWEVALRATHPLLGINDEGTRERTVFDVELWRHRWRHRGQNGFVLHKVYCRFYNWNDVMYTTWIMRIPDKQRVLMHGHQGWNVRHGLCHIYMIYVYIWVVYSFCLFCCLFIVVTTQFVALYKPCKPKPKPSTYA